VIKVTRAKRGLKETEVIRELKGLVVPQVFRVRRVNKASEV
jgi:hypothetical protein